MLVARPADIAVRLQARRRVLAAAASVVVAPLAGCGFHLRGAARLPFRTLHMPADTPLALELRRQLRASNIELTPKVEGAEAVLDLQEAREREVLAFSSTGRPREYQLRTRLRFRLHDNRGREFIPWSEIALRREITLTDFQVVSRAEEEALLFRDMQNDAVQQLLRRLAAAKLG